MNDMNMVRGKVWGDTRCIFLENNVEIHRISAKKGGYCSKHKHDYKYNMFFVESGKMEVVIYRPDAGQVLEDVTVLSSGELTYVEPGLYHMFRALEDTVALEVYWVTLDRGDISRESVGGMR